MSSNGQSDDELSSAFGVESAAKVTGFSARQLARWDRDGWYSPAYGDPERRGPLGRFFSYADLVRLRTARALMDRGVPVRRALAAVAELTSPDWREVPATPLYVAGRDVYRRREDAVERVGKVEAVEPAGVIAEVDDGIRRLSIRTPEQIGATHRKRGLVNGEEVFVGTRIPVTTITSVIESGWPRQEILDNYPRLRNADVDVAESRARRTVVSAG